MKQVKVDIGDKSYICDLLESEEDKRKGLMNIDYLPPDRGALFVWDDEDTREMWMKDTKIPLDQIAINDDDEVVLVYKAQPEDETLVPFMNAKYILEVNQDSGIVEGDDFEIDDSETRQIRNESTCSRWQYLDVSLGRGKNCQQKRNKDLNS